MIRKIEQLASIGKFRNYKATGDVSFSKLTLFYADNGIGKTTLAAVLRSLTLNQPEIITKRISTDHTTPQTAQIIERERTEWKFETKCEHIKSGTIDLEKVRNSDGTIGSGPQEIKLKIYKSVC